MINKEHILTTEEAMVLMESGEKCRPVDWKIKYVFFNGTQYMMWLKGFKKPFNDFDEIKEWKLIINK